MSNQNNNQNTAKKSNAKTVIILLIIVALIAIVPLFALKGAEFGGSDDKGGEIISEIQGKEYQPWFTPVLESALGGELPGEVESMIFCLQTGIGVGIIAFLMGRFVERKKWQNKTAEQDAAAQGNPEAQPAE